MFHLKDLSNDAVNYCYETRAQTYPYEAEFRQAIIYGGKIRLSLFEDITYQGFDLIRFNYQNDCPPIAGEIFLIKIPDEDKNLFKILFGDMIHVI